MHGRLAFTTSAFALGHFLSNAHKLLHTVLFRGGSWDSCGLYAGFPMPGVFGYGYGLFRGSDGVLLQNDKDNGTVKVTIQLPGGSEFCPVRCKVGQSPPAPPDSRALPQQQRGELVKTGGGDKDFPYGLP